MKINTLLEEVWEESVATANLDRLPETEVIGLDLALNPGLRGRSYGSGFVDKVYDANMVGIYLGSLKVALRTEDGGVVPHGYSILMEREDQGGFTLDRDPNDKEFSLLQTYQGRPGLEIPLGPLSRLSDVKDTEHRWIKIIREIARNPERTAPQN